MNNTVVDVVVSAVTEAAVASSVFINLEAYNMVKGPLELVSVYGYDYFSDVLGVNIYLLETPGAPVVMALDEDEFKWGQRDSDGIAWIAEDEQALNMIGGEWFISFKN